MLIEKVRDTFMESALLCDEIYDILENEIVSLQVRPGETLSENSLCKRFSVSRTPVRSVLQRLQQNRFVQIIPHKETVVTPIDLDIASQLIYQRVAVETMILRDFVNLSTPTDVARLRYAMQLMEEAATDLSEPEHFDINNFLEKDLNMHKIWFRTTNKMFLWETLTRPQPDYSRFIRLDIVGAKNVADVLTDHRRMIELIDSKNIEAIEEVMSHHLFGGVRRLGGQLFSEEYKDFFLQKNLE